MRFRDRLLGTLRQMQPVLDVEGVMVGGSQVPNLLEPEAAATLVVSQDVDLVVPVARLGEVKAALERVEGYSPAPDEPSVWTSEHPERLEVNFIGLDPVLHESSESYPVLSLVKPLPEMPDPSAAREHVVRLIELLETVA